MTQSKPQSPPRRHHFIPEFLLKQWADSGNMLYRFWQRGDGSIGCKPASPKSVAFEDRLYESVGYPAEHAQEMEHKFFAPLDDRAAKAHLCLLNDRDAEMTGEMMADWARFIMSLWFRTPGDTKGLRQILASFAKPGVSERIVGLPVPEDFPDAGFSQLQMELIRTVIDDRERGEALLNMKWGCVNLEPSRQFMISDWPLDSAENLPFLGHPRSYITVPLSPGKMFFAAASREFGPALGKLSYREIERRHNYAVVSQARSFVGTASKKAHKFVEKNFGKEHRPSIARTLASAYGLEIK